MAKAVKVARVEKVAKVAKVAKATLEKVSTCPREDGKQKADGRAASETKVKEKDIKGYAGDVGKSVTSKASARASTRTACQYKERKCQFQSNRHAA